MLSPLPVKTVIQVHSDTVKCEKSNDDDIQQMATLPLPC